MDHAFMRSLFVLCSTLCLCLVLPVLFVPVLGLVNLRLELKLQLKQWHGVHCWILFGYSLITALS